MTKETTGYFKNGVWIPFTAKVHNWHHGSKNVREYTDIQEAYEDYFYSRRGDCEYIEKITVTEGDHTEIFPLCVDDKDRSYEKRLIERYHLEEIPDDFETI